VLVPHLNQKSGCATDTMIDVCIRDYAGVDTG